MEIGQRNDYISPHWKRDPSFIEGPDSAGSFSIPVRALNIAWGRDHRYWRRITLGEDENRSVGFEEAVLLDQVNWFEVTGMLDIPCLNLAVHTTYRLYYVVKFLPGAFGWHTADVKFKVKFKDTQEIMSTELIILETYKKQPDQWHEIPGGKPFVVNNEVLITTVEFGMFEVETDWWKGGMVLGGVKVKPDNPPATELQ
nr:protein PHLOEM PROTEIN 2-LIKE A2-like [Coffea arabica]